LWHRVFLRYQFNEIGKRLKESELPGSVRAVSGLNPAEQFTFDPDQIGSHRQQYDQHDTQLDDQKNES
jgi:hypothetical protein